VHKNYYVLQKLSAYQQLVHAFATKAAGDMEFKYRDARNGQRRAGFAHVLSIPGDRVVKMEQVHGTAIAVVGERHIDPIEGHKAVKEVDGLLTQDPNVFLFAKTADCLPIVYFDPKERVVGLAHAGWRGVIGKLPALMIGAMAAHFGSQAKNILVGIGPCLDKTANLVQPPVVQADLPEWQGFCVREEEGYRIDMVGFAIKQLELVGVPKTQIEVGGLCTALHPNEFYSTYVNPNERGRFGTLVGLRR
jgi:YfiH family protein